MLDAIKSSVSFQNYILILHKLILGKCLCCKQPKMIPMMVEGSVRLCGPSLR